MGTISSDQEESTVPKRSALDVELQQLCECIAVSSLPAHFLTISEGRIGDKTIVRCHRGRTRSWLRRDSRFGAIRRGAEGQIVGQGISMTSKAGIQECLDIMFVCMTTSGTERSIAPLCRTC